MFPNGGGGRRAIYSDAADSFKTPKRIRRWPGCNTLYLTEAKAQGESVDTYMMCKVGAKERRIFCGRERVDLRLCARE